MRKRAWVFALLGPLPQAIAYIGGPLALSRRGSRHGWRQGRPRSANLVGLIPLAAGSAVISTAIASHYDAAPEEVPITVVPTYLATGGIYAMTRNPMYLGGVLMQAGWAILLGSLPITVAGFVFFVAIDRFGIPFEERMLHDRFGGAYDSYRRSVPRWIRISRLDPDS